MHSFATDLQVTNGAREMYIAPSESTTQVGRLGNQSQQLWIDFEAKMKLPIILGSLLIGLSASASEWNCALHAELAWGTQTVLTDNSGINLSRYSLIPLNKSAADTLKNVVPSDKLCFKGTITGGGDHTTNPPRTYTVFVYDLKRN